MHIKFLGAAGTVTGSSYLLTSDAGEQLLIDLGSFQGPQEVSDLNYAPFACDPSKLVGAILTHAHLDHCGRFPMIEKLGFTANVFMTAPTIDLANLSLLDSAKISQEDHPDMALYDEGMVHSLVNRFRVADYDREFSISGFNVVFRDAGHILGSASIEITVDGKKIVFSGDLGNTPEDLVKATEKVAAADFVVMESTYGDKAHPPGDPETTIQSEINAVESAGGTLLIPAFSLERTQELLHIISHLKSSSAISPDTPIYMDSPMAEKATHIYKQYKGFMNAEVQADFVSSDPFNFPGLHIVDRRSDSVKLNSQPGPQVIIAGSGMMTGGRVVDHAKRLLSQDTTRLLIVGFQGEGTLGRELVEGAKSVIIGKETVPVHAHLTEIQVMSSHADQPRLMDWLKSIQGVQKVMLTHGEDLSRTALSSKITADLGIADVVLPKLNDELSL